MNSNCLSKRRGALVVLLTIAASAIPGTSFVHHTVNSNAESTYRRSALQVFDFSSTRSTLTEKDLDPQDASIDRRTALLTGASVAAGYFLKENILSSNAPAILTTLESSVESGTIEPSVSSVSSVEKALELIESRGDKRFLHAVVASDYKFLYEQSETLQPDIDVEKIFSKKVPIGSDKSRPVVLATTGNLEAKRPASLWPLGNAMASSNDIHYAWPELGGALEPNKSDYDGSTTDRVTQKLIVDGIDCGKMSLEDALEGKMQILVQTPTYLLVPSHMESSLRKGLQEAFLI